MSKEERLSELFFKKEMELKQDPSVGQVRGAALLV